MKRLICSMLILALTLLPGCGNLADTEVPIETEMVTGLTGSISTNGSTSMEKMVAALIESFTAENPGTRITYNATGSSAGMAAALDGTADIGLSSRNLKASEESLNATIIALDAIAVIVNTSNLTDDLKVEDIAGLFTGKITNWSEVGGDDRPVAIIGREGGSGTREGFESVVGISDECIYDQELTSTGAVITAVASNINAIGYASLAAVSDKVKTVTVEGVECTEDTVLDGSYRVQRPFIMAVPEGREVSDIAAAFIEFALSSDTTDIIANTGAVQVR